MQSFKASRLASALAVLSLLLAQTPPAAPAQGQRPPRDQPDEIIRVDTELVQTGVTVLDKQGRFVEGLTRDQFELKVDGRAQPVAFFERVTAGSASEEAQIAAARGQSRPAAAGGSAPVGSPDRGRTFFFFVDDLHMTAESVIRARQLILRFVERDMGQNDQAAVTSASNQLGFLQQLTDNKAVLRAAAERLKPLQRAAGDMRPPPMTEYLALAIQERGDRDVLAFYVQALLRESDAMRPDIAEQIVRSRADQILQETVTRTKNTLYGLGSFVRGVSPLPGRKVVYFLSDGFLLRMKDTSVNDQLRRVTDAAARSGVVVYTADARGLVTDPSLDVESGGIFDASGAVARATRNELAAVQEPLRSIAEDTGGRALLSTNAVDVAVAQTVKETSTYYLIAWQPGAADPKGGKFRSVEVSVKGRPDLTVLVQRGFLQSAGEAQMVQAAAAKPAPEKPKTPADELRAAISAPYPVRSLPTALAVNYVDTPKDGVVLTASMSVPYEALGLGGADAKAAAELDVEGHVYNVEGRSGSRFRERLKVAPAADGGDAGRRRSVLYSHQVALAPGLYQVRVAARDAASGRVGSTAQWVEIPDLKAGKLTLGSVQIGERPDAKSGPQGAQGFVGQFDAERRFARGSHLRFLTFVYNAKAGAQGAAPDVVMQIQIFRNDQPVVTDELRKVSAAGQDFARLAYGAEISLASLSVGRYVLQVTAIDRVAKTSASQRVNFTVE